MPALPWRLHACCEAHEWALNLLVFQVRGSSGAAAVAISVNSASCCVQHALAPFPGVVRSAHSLSPALAGVSVLRRRLRERWCLQPRAGVQPVLGQQPSAGRWRVALAGLSVWTASPQRRSAGLSESPAPGRRAVPSLLPGSWQEDREAHLGETTSRCPLARVTAAHGSVATGCVLFVGNVRGTVSLEISPLVCSNPRVTAGG